MVCRRCERWNLTPLEERWEAIDEAERLYQGTRSRHSTDQIGLARVADDGGRFDLVRIGNPPRRELAAWRYGDQIVRRRRTPILMHAGVAAGAAAVFVSPYIGVIGLGAITLIQGASVVQGIHSFRSLLRLPVGGGRAPITLRRRHARFARLISDGGELRLSIPALADEGRWWKPAGPRVEETIEGTAAILALGKLMAAANIYGATTREVTSALGALEAHGSGRQLIAGAAAQNAARRTYDYRQPRSGTIATLPHAIMLAIEIASHEETERRALEGELALLEAAWKDAEEIANIADAL